MKMFSRQQLVGVIIGTAIVSYVVNPNEPKQMLISMVMGVVLAHVMKAAVELCKEKCTDNKPD